MAARAERRANAEECDPDEARELELLSPCEGHTEEVAREDTEERHEDEHGERDSRDDVVQIREHTLPFVVRFHKISPLFLM